MSQVGRRIHTAPNSTTSDETKQSWWDVEREIGAERVQDPAGVSPIQKAWSDSDEEIIQIEGSPVASQIHDYQPTFADFHQFCLRLPCAVIAFTHYLNQVEGSPTKHANGRQIYMVAR